MKRPSSTTARTMAKRAFWFQPPDTDTPIQFVRVDQDPQFVQDFENPLGAGVAERVTLPLIEVSG